MKRLAQTLALFMILPLLYGQQPQSSTAPNSGVSAKYANGIAPGYRPTISTGLVLAVGPGTCNLAGTPTDYAGGTLTLTASATNYVYLNLASSCSPAFKTTVFTSSDFPIAVVITGTSTITATCNANGVSVGTGTFPCIHDVRTFFFSGGGSAAPSTITGSGLTAGKVYYVNGSGTLALAEANASTTVPAVCIATSTTTCQLTGVYTTTGLTAASIYYVSDSSPGAIVAVIPTTSSHYIQRIGVAFSTTQLLLSFSPDVGGIQ